MNLTKKQEGFLSFGAAVIVLMLSMSFTLYLVDPCYSNLFVNYITGNAKNCLSLSASATGTTGVVAGVNDQLTGIFGALGVLGGGAIIAFSVAFPNGYQIFAAAAYFLLGGATMPINLFSANSGLPNELRLFIVAIFSLLNIFAVLSYLGAKNY